jgi:hypothetical protein
MGKVVPFIGAGISIPAGLPNWIQLLQLVWLKTQRRDCDDGHGGGDGGGSGSGGGGSGGGSVNGSGTDGGGVDSNISSGANSGCAAAGSDGSGSRSSDGSGSDGSPARAHALPPRRRRPLQPSAQENVEWNKQVVAWKCGKMFTEGSYDVVFSRSGSILTVATARFFGVVAAAVAIVTKHFFLEYFTQSFCALYLFISRFLEGACFRINIGLLVPLEELFLPRSIFPGSVRKPSRGIRGTLCPVVPLGVAVAR